jgi:hypothetical protein
MMWTCKLRTNELLGNYSDYRENKVIGRNLDRRDGTWPTPSFQTLPNYWNTQPFKIIQKAYSKLHFTKPWELLFKSGDSSVGIALDYGLDDRGSRVQLPAGAENFSIHHRVQNGSGAHPASYPMGTRVSFPSI